MLLFTVHLIIVNNIFYKFSTMLIIATCNGINVLVYVEMNIDPINGVHFQFMAPNVLANVNALNFI